MGCKFEVEIDKRVWDQDENPAVLEEYLLGEELSSSLTGVKDHWVKTKAFVRVLMSPVKKIQKDLTDALSKNEEDKIFDDTFESKDCYMLVANAIEKYSKIIIVILAKEAELDGDITHGESSILEGSSVVRWALNDLGGEADVDIVSRWWVFAIDALQQSTYSVGGIDGMIVDGSAAESAAET